MTKSLKYNCVFGGGGVRGICYVGAIKALEEANIEIDGIAGSSVGAVFAMLYAIGYEADDIKEFFMEFNFSIFRDINIKLFDGDISLSKGEIFLEWLREKIELKFYGEGYKKGSNPPVCFKDIDRNLNILTLDINTNTQYIFSKETTPYEEIAMAVRISASMPGLMKPVQKDECTLVDGDLIKTRPAFKIYDNFNNSDNRILEFRLEGTRDGNSIKKPSDYLNTVISTIWYLSTEYIYELYHNNDKYDFIIMDAKEVILFDFSIDRTVREYLIDKGYKTTTHYLTKTLVEKKKNILEIYRIILKSLLYLENEIGKGNAKGSINIINEVLSNMVEYISYIDSLIYKKLRELKSELICSVKRTLIFTDTLDNKKSLNEKNQFLIFLLKAKIEELENYINL